ncbi:MAG: response regulator [Acidobacteria bacterium]|nr:response regulator [Acidobacteriota bacterium]MBI3281091.1 response regulator [Acidobacteriota bacterium]
MKAGEFNRAVQILQIEDNPGDLALLREALRDSRVPYQLTAVTDGEEALRYLYREPPYQSVCTPDLILLDLNLPRKDGREVLREIKEDLGLARIPVVVLTTSVSPLDVRAVYDLRANCYLPKPHDIDQFFKLVRLIEEFWLISALLPPHDEADSNDQVQVQVRGAMASN